MAATKYQEYKAKIRSWKKLLSKSMADRRPARTATPQPPGPL